MATIKSYTDLEQSRKLAEILPLKSADMEYMFLKKDSSKISNVPFVKDGFEEPECCYIFIPCWSLAALLNVLPNDNSKCTTMTRGRYDTRTRKYINEWCVYYNEINGANCMNVFGENPVDACVDIIEKLHKRKML